MAKHNSLFEDFLSAIDPDEDAVAYAQEAHKPVRKALGSDEQFGQYITNTFLYGSYKRHTAVGDIKDVDIVVLTNFDITDTENTPQRVLRKLKAALARHYKDPDNPEYQRRSIRINDPLPHRPDVTMTLDIIPAVAVNGEDQPLRVPDRELKEWIESHPKGHIVAISALNADGVSNGKFVPLVKMMKWWWKYQCELRQPDVERPKPKGFWVECLTRQCFDLSQSDWADHFIAVLANIKVRYEHVTEPPQLADPGLPGQTIKTNMTLDEFRVFIRAVSESLETAIAAREHDDKLESSLLWREVFGEIFPLYEVGETTTTEQEPNTEQEPKPILGDDKHAQKLRWTENLNPKKRRVYINAFLYRNGEPYGGLNSDGLVLNAGMKIKFVAKPKVRGAYEVYWQVVNTGQHAAGDNGLRGDFFTAKHLDGSPTDDPLVNWESTKYKGKHWIQCFIIQNGQCVAKSKRFYVNVQNREYQG